MRTPRTPEVVRHRRRVRTAAARLRRIRDRWGRRTGDTRTPRWWRDAIPTTSRWFRQTLPRTAERLVREDLPAAGRRLREDLPDVARHLREQLPVAAERLRAGLASERLRAGLASERLRARALLAVLVLALAVVPTGLSAARSSEPRQPDLAGALTQREAASDTPARSATRSGAPATPTEPAAAFQSPLAEPTSSPSPSPSATPAMALAASPTPSPKPSPKPKPSPSPKRIEPIGGLDERQMEHAATIVRVGQQMGLPRQAYVVALATALQESNLRNLANPAYPESYNYRHDGSGYDHDSVGLFQQRPSMGWGTVAQIMDPAYAARAFYEQLRRIPGWENMPVTVAAQAVQVSAFPDHYAKHEPLARQLVDALT